jgi:glycopeptide antibiotics resistance protein
VLPGVLVLLAPVLLGYLGFQLKAGMRVRDAAVWAVLGVYALWAADLLFFPVVIDPVLRDMYRFDQMRYWVNLVPFATIWAQLRDLNSTSARQLFGNCGLLVPLGLLGPLVMPSLRRIRRLAVVSLAVSAGIELVQLVGTLPHFLRRSVDVDDVILNVAGALLAWLVWATCAAACARVSSRFGWADGARDLSNKRIEQDAASYNE